MKIIQNSVLGEGIAVQLSVEEVELLATMLVNDVLGQPGHGEAGLIEAVNEGSLEDEYWGTHYTNHQVLTFIREYLIHIPHTQTVSDGVDMIDAWTIGEPEDIGEPLIDRAMDGDR